MTHLTAASRQLFSRSPDECFETLSDVHSHCQRQKEASVEHWEQPAGIATQAGATGSLMVKLATDGAFEMTDWGFSQLCRHAGVSKETVNRLSAETASRVFAETLPRGSNKPLQVFELDGYVRSIHAASYTRPTNAGRAS